MWKLFSFLTTTCVLLSYQITIVQGNDDWNRTSIWKETSDIIISDDSTNNNDDNRIAMSGDGSIMAMASSSTIQTYTNTNYDDNWKQLDSSSISLPPSASIDTMTLSKDGSTLAIVYSTKGNSFTSGTTKAQLYQLLNNNNEWIPKGESIDSNAISIALSNNGDIVALRSLDNNDKLHVSIMEYVGGTTWQAMGTSAMEQDVTEINSISHHSIALSGDGRILALSGIKDDSYYTSSSSNVYEYNGQDWSPTNGDSMISETTGMESVYLSADGTTLVVASSTHDNNTGRVQIYRKSAEGWMLLGSVPGSTPGELFGASVDISQDGRSIAVGAPGKHDNTGEVVVMEHKSGTEWIGRRGEPATKGGEIGFFGQSVAISDDGSTLAASSSTQIHLFESILATFVSVRMETFGRPDSFLNQPTQIRRLEHYFMETYKRLERLSASASTWISSSSVSARINSQGSQLPPVLKATINTEILSDNLQEDRNLGLPSKRLFPITVQVYYECRTSACNYENVFLPEGQGVQFLSFDSNFAGPSSEAFSNCLNKGYLEEDDMVIEYTDSAQQLTPLEQAENFPTMSPSDYPTNMPSASPSAEPTSLPSHNPTPFPTTSPSDYPTRTPSASPTSFPSSTPSTSPTGSPTISSIPSYSPTSLPSNSPLPPTSEPTTDPSASPTFVPTYTPSWSPSFSPTSSPSFAPSPYPTETAATFKPTVKATAQPTWQPTLAPVEQATEGHWCEGPDIPITWFNEPEWVWEALNYYCSYDGSVSMYEHMTAVRLGPIECWDVHNITNMEGMFAGRVGCYPDIHRWDVGKVQNFRGMFAGTDYNPDISGWDTSSGQLFGFMFEQNPAFNRDISRWDMSSATDLTAMFAGAQSFNQEIGAWNVGGVEVFYGTFFGASAFNGNLNNWDVRAGVMFAGMFAQAHSFNQDLSRWQPQSAQNMAEMFRGARSYNQDLSSWELTPYYYGGNTVLSLFCFGAMSWVKPKPLGMECDLSYYE